MRRVCLTAVGEIVEEEMRRTGEVHSGIRVDAFVIMPNHVHVILILEDGPDRPPRFGVVVNGFKSTVTRRVRARLGGNFDLWQRGYYEHIVRSERELDLIREYIAANPERWAEDQDQPSQRPR